MNGRILVYYVSAHGYGHGVRTCDVLNAFCRKYPKVAVAVVSGLPVRFLRSRLGAERIRFREGCFDVGMVQKDSVRVDLPATLSAMQNVQMHHDAWVRKETDFLRTMNANLVVADVPSIPMAAARAAGIPCVAIGNFAWNWIYEPFARQDGRWQEVIDMLEADYRQADMLLRLPFAEPMRVFKHQRDIPLLASPGETCRQALARATGASLDKKWVLLSFVDLAWDDVALKCIEQLTDYEFFSVFPLHWPGSCVYTIDRDDFRFADILASVDLVVSKPGFGLVSECIVNHKPLLYVDRTHFAEYPILVEGIERYLKNVHIPQQDFYAGRLENSLDALLNAPEPREKIANNGAECITDVFAKALTEGI